MIVVRPERLANAEDRTKEYRLWHRKLGSEYYAADIDQIEFRRKNGKLVPVAVLEMTRVDYPGSRPENFLGKIWNRIAGRGHRTMLQQTAEALGTQAFIVVFRADLSEFWVTSTLGQAWRHFTQEEYSTWIKNLPLSTDLTVS